MSDIHDAIRSQSAWARAALATAHDVRNGLHRSLIRVEDRTGDWEFSDSFLKSLVNETGMMSKVKVPSPVLLAGRFDELAPRQPATDENNRRALTRLKEVSQERAHLIEVLRLQSGIWREVDETFRDAGTRITASAERRLETADFLVKFVELEVGAISLQLVDFMTTLVPALGERASRAAAIRAQMDALINELERDLESFNQALEIGEWVHGIGAAPPALRWQNPNDITRDLEADVAELYEKIVAGTIDAFERAEELQDRAERDARRNRRIGLLRGLLDITGAVANLAANRRSGGEMPDRIEYHGVSIQTPQLGYLFEAMLKQNAAGTAWIHGGSLPPLEVTGPESIRRMPNIVNRPGLPHHTLCRSPSMHRQRLPRRERSSGASGGYV